LFPDSYEGHSLNGSDIGLIGLQPEHYDTIENYYNSISDNNKINYFDDRVLEEQ
jgi:hypothetical protein